MINIYKTQRELIVSMTWHFIKIVNAAIDTRGAVNVTLAGGSSPKKLYGLLVTDEYKKQVDWSKNKNSLETNAMFLRMMPKVFRSCSKKLCSIRKKYLLHKYLKLIQNLRLMKPQKKYNETIVAHVKQMPVRFDFMLLGLGDNAHAASLIPYATVLAETSATVEAIFLKEQNSYRITMTAPLINQSRQIAFLVYRKEKAEAVNQVLKDALDAEKYPGQSIHSTDGELQWFLDDDAASLLNNDPINYLNKSL